MEIDVRSPFPYEALPRVYNWIQPFLARVSDDFSPQNLSEFLISMSAKLDQQKSWAIYASGELGGLITFERISPWLGTAHLILKPDFQGKGIALRACRHAVAEMFAAGIGKLAFYPLAYRSTTKEGGKYEGPPRHLRQRLALGSLLINLGARNEGRMIGHTLCGGKPTDILIYGLTKEEFQNATAHSRPDRRRSIDTGSRPGGTAENHNVHADDDAKLLARGPGHDGPDHEVLAVLGAKS